MSSITSVHAREILDSRGNPTVEVDVKLESGKIGRAPIPSGASTGAHEAVELRDNDLKRFNGKGVLKACENINGEIFDSIFGKEAQNQSNVDDFLVELDGTPNKNRLGANSILGVSLAIAKASAAENNLPVFQYLGGEAACDLPVPMMNIINGGAHADNNIAFQEFMIMPVGARNFFHAIQVGSEIAQSLKSILKSAGHSTNVGDEGGFAPALESAEEAIDFILESIESCGYIPGKEVFLAIDCAASEYFHCGLYNIDGKKYSLTPAEKVEYLKKLTRKFPIFSIEDAMGEDDWDGWLELTQEIGNTCQLVGDDLFATNSKRLNKGINKGIANSVLIKPNQIGTLTETLRTISMAQDAGYSTIISHRSGETEDTIISDIAVATKSGQIKAGALSRSDRTAKYNQLIRIEEYLGGKAIYSGRSILHRNNNIKKD